MAPPTTHAVPGLDLVAEARLDPAITFPAEQSHGALNPSEPRRVFLSGATGFVGAFLLHELLRTTGADVTCLIRADGPTAAQERLLRHLQSYGLWQEAFAGRVHPIVGDLDRPRFGLDESEFSDLASCIDVIYHSAGSTHALHSYERLKPTNVLGTQQILRLAGSIVTKPVHHLSTMAVLFTDEHVGVDRLSERDLPLDPSSIKGGYAQSKWVAERMVLAAQERGMPGSIYRFVRVMGHSQTGAMNEMHDLLPLVLKACVHMGTCPALDVDVTMAPVDYVARAVVHLSRQARSYGRAFHLFTPQPIRWATLIATIRSFGYPLDELPYREWVREVRRQASGDADAGSYAGLFMLLISPHYLLYPRPPMDTTYTREGLANTDISCPPASPDLIGRYVDYWQQVGYFPPPPSSTDAKEGAAP